MLGLCLIMKNNIMQFGDTYWKQLTGTAMGTPPACAYATLYYAYHEYEILNDYSDCLLYYKRYIDDIFGIWCPPPNCPDPQRKWNAFKRAINNYGKLQWNTENLATTVTFLDLVITIENNRITTIMHEKKLNLYLYLPP